jgi:hypothetical protein
MGFGTRRLETSAQTVVPIASSTARPALQRLMRLMPCPSAAPCIMCAADGQPA